MLEISTPISSQDWQDYYQLRWQVLRAPWQQPRGSEQDELEDESQHRFIRNQTGEVIAVARLHFNSCNEAQVRYMAVAEQCRNQHLGSRLLHALELLAWRENAANLVLFARERALEFYKKHGYEILEKAHLAYGDVQHWKMIKSKPAAPGWFRQPQWTQLLQDTWREDIPISTAMGIQIESYTDWQFTTSAALKPNINIHGSMFAGSVYSLATLTGWGSCYLALKEAGLEGDIVLADASIKYSRPITGDAKGQVMLARCHGDLSVLNANERAKYTVPVTIFCEEQEVAEFTGYFVIHPAK